MWIYKDWLYEQLVKISKNLDYGNYKFEVYDEQDYTKDAFLDDRTILVVIKHLSSTNALNTKIQPLQITILSEENGLVVASAVFRQFATLNNWTVTHDGSTYYKHSYSDPAVMNNFVGVKSGNRSILYVSANLFIMTDVVDIKNFKIDGEDQKYISLNMGYALTPDTQIFNDSPFPKSVAIFGSTGVNLVIPCVNTNFVSKCLQVALGKITGDTTVTLTGNLGGFDFTFDMKIGSVNFATGIADIPALQVGLLL